VRGGGALAGVLLAAVLAGCGSEAPSEPDTAPEPPLSAGAGAPPSLEDLGANAFAVRDTLIGSIEAAGAVRASVTGLPAETTLDLVHDTQRDRFARRFVWQEAGETREVLQLRTRQVCLNLAAARALQAAGNNVMGAIVGSDQAYSCSAGGDSSVAGFVMFGNGLRDPVARLGALMGDLRVTDVGVEEDEDQASTRHLRLEAVETGSSMQPVPTTWDLWVDGDLRLVRAEFTSLSEVGAVHTAELDYDSDVPAVTRPADAGALAFEAGTGTPGVGGYLVSQFGTSPPQ
jgi:hypothetical protein